MSLVLRQTLGFTRFHHVTNLLVIVFHTMTKAILSGILYKKNSRIHLCCDDHNGDGKRRVTELCVKLVGSFAYFVTSNQPQAISENKTQKILLFHQNLLLKTSADNSFLQKYRNLKNNTL